MTQWKPTHRLLAQHVRLLGKHDEHYLVEFEDGSVGWIDGFPHDEVMVPIDVVDKEALRAYYSHRVRLWRG